MAAQYIHNAGGKAILAHHGEVDVTNFTEVENYEKKT
jgi:hypothetical protein